MKNAVLRLMGIILTSIGVIAVLLFTIRQLGGNQQYSPLDHELMNMERLVILDHLPVTGVSQSQPALTEAATKCPKCLIKLDIRLSLDDVPFVYSSEELKGKTSGAGYFSLQNASQIDQMEYSENGGRVLKLTEAVALLPNQPLYLVVHTRDASKIKHILASLQNLSASESIIVASPYRQTLTDIRKERPRWLYTTPPAFLMRVQMMRSLFIETMADIWPDFLVTRPDQSKSSPVPAGVVDEYLKRHKRIIVETHKKETFLTWKSKVENAGLLTNKIDLALEVMNLP